MFSSAFVICFFALISTTLAANVGLKPNSFFPVPSSAGPVKTPSNPIGSIMGGPQAVNQVQQHPRSMFGPQVPTANIPAKQALSGLPGVPQKAQGVLPQVNVAPQVQQQLQQQQQNLGQAAAAAGQQFQQMAKLPEQLLKRIQHYVIPQQDGSNVFGITDPTTMGVVYTKTEQFIRTYMEAVSRVKQMQNQLEQQLANMSKFVQQIDQFEKQQQLQLQQQQQQNQLSAGYPSNVPAANTHPGQNNHSRHHTHHNPSSGHPEDDDDDEETEEE